MLAIHHPDLVDCVATFGTTFGPPHEALNLEMLRTETAPSPESGAFQFQRDHYMKVAPDPTFWPKFWRKVCNLQWNGFSKKELSTLKAPILIALGDHDFVRVEHALEIFKLIPNAELAVIPDAGHFALFSEPTKVVPIVENFLKKPDKKIPIATAETGYRPGETR